MSAQKLALIDPQLLKDLIFMAKERNNTTKTCNPPADPYLKSMCENQTKMQNIIENPTMSDDKKVLLYNQALDRFMTMNEKQNQSDAPHHPEEQEGENQEEQETLDLSKEADKLQWSSYGGTKSIFKYLKTKGMTINPAGEVVLKGSPIVGSNFKSLIDEFGSTRKNLKPNVIGIDQLMDFIKVENLDTKYVRNPAIRQHFQLDRAFEKAKRRRFDPEESEEEDFFDTTQQGQGIKWFKFENGSKKNQTTA